MKILKLECEECERQVVSICNCHSFPLFFCKEHLSKHIERGDHNPKSIEKWVSHSTGLKPKQAVRGFSSIQNITKSGIDKRYQYTYIPINDTCSLAKVNNLWGSYEEVEIEGLSEPFSNLGFLVWGSYNNLLSYNNKSGLLYSVDVQSGKAVKSKGLYPQRQCPGVAFIDKGVIVIGGLGDTHLLKDSQCFTNNRWVNLPDFPINSSQNSVVSVGSLVYVTGYWVDGIYVGSNELTVYSKVLNLPFAKNKILVKTANEEIYLFTEYNKSIYKMDKANSADWRIVGKFNLELGHSCLAHQFGGSIFIAVFPGKVYKFDLKTFELSLHFNLFSV